MTVIKAWNSGTSTWEVIAVGAQGPAGDITSSVLNDLSDVVTSSNTFLQSLTYDGTNWVNTYAPVVSEVRNVDTVTLPVGTVVYLYGATGDRADVKRADFTSDTTSSKTVGVVAQSIAVNGIGPVVTRGYVTGMNLSAYTPGQILYLNTAGGVTSTKPSAPNHLVFIGVAVRCNSNGIMYIATQNGYELDELHNVQASSPSTNDYLKYNGSLWVNSPINLSTDTTNTLPIARGGTNGSATPTAGGVNYGTGTAHAFTSAGTSGQVLQSAGSSAPTWATYARGFVSQDTSTAGSAYYSSSTTYTHTDLSITATVVAGRKYKWTVQGHVYTSGAPDIIRIGLLDGSNVAGCAVDTLVNTQDLATAFTLTFYETASTTSLTRKVSVARASGSGTNVYFFADTDRKAFLTLEDVGI